MTKHVVNTVILGDVYPEDELQRIAKNYVPPKPDQYLAIFNRDETSGYMVRGGTIIGLVTREDPDSQRLTTMPIKPDEEDTYGYYPHGEFFGTGPAVKPPIEGSVYIQTERAHPFVPPWQPQPRPYPPMKSKNEQSVSIEVFGSAETEHLDAQEAKAKAKPIKITKRALRSRVEQNIKNDRARSHRVRSRIWQLETDVRDLKEVVRVQQLTIRVINTTLESMSASLKAMQKGPEEQPVEDMPSNIGGTSVAQGLSEFSQRAIDNRNAEFEKRHAQSAKNRIILRERAQILAQNRFNEAQLQKMVDEEYRKLSAEQSQ